MNSNLNIPQTIKVGFQKRSDTYSGFLAYVVYLKKDKSIAKETSWKGWCDNKIPTKELPNEPLEGFVLNKKAGGYASGWNHRQTYCRVWDPRGWEVEISIPNLLYILQECNCEKGKGLSGKFVYAWDGKDLILLPTSSEDYIKSKELIEKTENIKISDLVIGKSYFSITKDVQTYLGARNVYIPTVGKFKQHLFLCNTDKTIKGYKSISNKFYYQTDDDVISLSECADYIDKIKDDDIYIKKGLTIKGFNFVQEKSVKLYDLLKEKISLKIEEIKKLRDICLNEVTKENYNNVYRKVYDFANILFQDALVKKNETKWLKYQIRCFDNGYYYNSFKNLLMEHPDYCNDEERILKNLEKIKDKHLYDIKITYKSKLLETYSIDKNGKITVYDNNDWWGNSQNSEDINDNTLIIVDDRKYGNTNYILLELTLSNDDKLKIKYSKYENGNEKTYRLTN